MILSNSSPLIYLAKLGKLDILKTLFKEIIIPKEVYEEVVIKGKEEKFFDALKVENSVQEGWLKVKETTINKEIETLAPEIDLGEIALISLAKKLKPSLILIDDASARAIAESFGFNVKGTLYILLTAYKKKIIDKNEIKELINRLIVSGFRISQELYINLLGELEKS